MCCFTQEVNAVTDTRIFARADKNERQFLVYSMQLKADQSLAMVLPLPVKHGAGEKDVTFVNLKEYLAFFEDLERASYVITTHGYYERSINSSASLEVVQVGDFEASFVP